MNINSFLLRTVFVGVCTMLCASASRAGSLSFNVDINTAALVGNSNGPFSLNFQLNQGASAINTVTLSNFVFTGGTPTGSATLIGGASGNLSSTVSLTDSANPFNEFFQGFSPATTKIDFNVLMTTNVDPTTPDLFAMAILDSSLANIPATGLGDSLIVVNINVSNLSLANVQTYTSLAPDSGVTVAATQVAATPEPGTLGTVFAFASAAFGWRKRVRSDR